MGAYVKHGHVSGRHNWKAILRWAFVSLLVYLERFFFHGRWDRVWCWVYCVTVHLVIVFIFSYTSRIMLDLRNYGLSRSAFAWLLFEVLAEPFWIKSTYSVRNLTSVKSAWAFGAKLLQFLCLIESERALTVSLFRDPRSIKRRHFTILQSSHRVIVQGSCCVVWKNADSVRRYG